MPRVLLLLETAFSLWMVVDAIRRGAAYYWYPVIMMPFGEWVYFFKVKIHDPELEWARDLYTRLTTRKVTIEELRYQAEHSPSFASKTTLAKALYDRGVYREAADLFAEAIALDGDSRDALYGLALSHAALGEHEETITGFQKLIALDPSFRDYAAYADLAEVLSQSQQVDEALALLDSLVIRSPRLRHRVLYAHYLIHTDQGEAAEEQLRAGLAELAHAPRYVQRKNRAWARRAQQMLKQI